VPRLQVAGRHHRHDLPNARVFAAACVAVLALGLANAGGAAVSQTMHGYVLDDFTTRLTFDDGSSVGSETAPGPTIPPGTYTVVVNDESELDNIHLTGPAVDYSTGVVANEAPTWTVTFQPGSSYKFQSDAHPNVAGYYGYFQTSTSGSNSSSSATTGSSSSTSGSTGAGTSSAGSGKSATTTLAGTLRGTIGPTGKASLLINGKAVSKLAPGRYKITVVDTSPRRGFVIRETGRPANTLSGIGFVGARSVTTNLSAGQWTLSSSGPDPSKASFFVGG
jgi:hypothetical protein